MDLIIVGAGGHGREALAVARAATRSGTAEWNVVGFVDDGPVDESRLESLGAPLLGGIRHLATRVLPHVIAIGDGSAREVQHAA